MWTIRGKRKCPSQNERSPFLQEDGDKEQKGNINNNIQNVGMWYSVTMSSLGQWNRKECVENHVRVQHGTWRDREDSAGRGYVYLLSSDLINSEHNNIRMS